MALIKKLIRMKKKKGNDIILSYPQTVEENVLVDSETMTLKAKIANLQSGINGKEALIKDVTVKSTLSDADTLPFTDSTDGSKTKKITWANIKALLKEYFATVYIAATQTKAGLMSDTDKKKLDDITTEKGASMVGINTNIYTAKTVEGVLAEINDRTQLKIYQDISVYVTSRPNTTPGTITIPLATRPRGYLFVSYNDDGRYEHRSWYYIALGLDNSYSPIAVVRKIFETSAIVSGASADIAIQNFNTITKELVLQVTSARTTNYMRVQLIFSDFPTYMYI